MSKRKRTPNHVKKAQMSQLARSLAQASTNSTSMVMNVAQLSVALVMFLLINTLIIFSANLFFPASVVLSNHLVTSLFMAALYSAGMVSVLVVGAMPIVEALADRINLKLSDIHWSLIAWALNVASVWLVGRFAELLGMGLSSWKVAVVLGLVLSLGQGFVMKRVVGKVK